MSAVAPIREWIRALSPLAMVLWTLLILGQVLLLAIYLLAFQQSLQLFHLYPLLWITVSAWVLGHVRAPAHVGGHRVLAGILATAYFCLLAYVGGLVGPGPELTDSVTVLAADAEFIYDTRVVTAVPPGYGPAILHVGPYLIVSIIPYLTVGYLALAYLVYLTVREAATAATSGLIGLFGCIGCSAPILASLVAGTSGAAGTIAAGVYTHAYPLSTLAFLLAVVLLVWRPGFVSPLSTDRG